MEYSEKRNNIINAIGNILFSTILIIYTLGQSDYIFGLGGCMTLFFLYKLYVEKKIYISSVDVCIIALWSYSALNYTISINHINSIQYFRDLTISILLYFFLRGQRDTWNEKKKILLLISFLTGIMGIISIVSFAMFSEQIHDVGFPNIYDFRFKYRPLGILSNVWASLQLCFGGIIILTAFCYRKVTIIRLLLYFIFVINMYNIIISFSRGIYISYIFLIAGLVIVIAKMKIQIHKKIILLTGIILPLLSLSCNYKEETNKTLKFNETISQQRSIIGRLDAIVSSKFIFKNSPIIGIGANNFSQGFDKYTYKNENTSFTSFAPNGYIQLIIEQGILGFFLWGGLILFIVWQWIKYRKKIITPCIIISLTIFSLLIREISFPAFFNCPIIILVCFSLLAIQQNFFNCNKFKITVHKPIIGAILTICLFLTISSTSQLYNTQNNQLAINYLEKNDLHNALHFINKTDQSTPFLFNRSIIYNKLFFQTQKKEFQQKAKYNILKAIKNDNNDNMLKFQLSRLLINEKQIDSAKIILSKLVQDNPNNVLFNIGYFEILYKHFNKNDALKYIIKAIILSPNVLKSTLIKSINKTDYKYMDKIKTRLQQKIGDIKLNDLNDPIYLAKFGKILLYLQEYDISKLYLQKAVSILPSLSMPWYHLGVIEAWYGNTGQATKYYLRYLALVSPNNRNIKDMKRLISSGEIHKNIDNTSLLSNYNDKFINWYNNKSAIIYDITNY